MLFLKLEFSFVDGRIVRVVECVRGCLKASAVVRACVLRHRLVILPNHGYSQFKLTRVMSMPFI